MHIYLEQPAQAQFWEIICKGSITTQRSGSLNTQGHQQRQDHANSSVAFDMAISAAKSKLLQGYQDPKGKADAAQLDATVYQQYLNAQQYDSAIHWLRYFGHLEDATWEDRLVEHYLQQEDYTAAEKYVLTNLQRSQDPNLSIRQIRYLATINPMLSRFMLGNLPIEMHAENPADYYKELAMAQSKIAFFDTLSYQIKDIKDPSLQLVYLRHLLHTAHDQNPQQLAALKHAQSILATWDTSNANKRTAYQQFIEGAQHIGQPALAMDLQAALQKLSKTEKES